jgi:arylsulfatase A-like enzyme
VLPWDTVTLAGTLGDAGYTTMISGKWHLGSSPEFGPTKFGFDRSYGCLAGGCTPYSHLYKGGKKVWHRNDELIEEEGHVTDLIADEAVAFLKEGHDKPFFLYVPFTAVHDPFDEPEQYLKIVEHIDAGRRQYAASAVHMDAAVGRIAAALKEHGHAEDTLLVFFSDNGGTRGETGRNYPKPVAMSQVQGSNLPLRGWKRDLYEGGIRVPAFAVWPGEIEPGTKMDHPVSAADWMPTLMRIAGQRPASELQLDGIDITGLLTGEVTDPGKRMFYGVNHRKASYARYGDWKLILDRDGKNPRLFDLSTDPYEKTDLAKDRPKIVSQLHEAIRAEAAKDRTALPEDQSK